MCLNNLFGENSCTWILFFIILLLLCGDDFGGSRRGCGC